MWEERFGEHAYVPLAEQAISDALKAAGITADEVDHVIVTGVHARAARVRGQAHRRPARGLRRRPRRRLGNTGTAQPASSLADVLDRAEPGQTS